MVICRKRLFSFREEKKSGIKSCEYPLIVILQLSLWLSPLPFQRSQKVSHFWWLPEPDEPFPNFRASKSVDPQIYVAQERHATDFKALKLWKGSSGEKDAVKIKKNQTRSTFHAGVKLIKGQKTETGGRISDEIQLDKTKKSISFWLVQTLLGKQEASEEALFSPPTDPFTN